MNESILEALMRLFAIVADVSEEGTSKNERDVVIEYLSRQFSNELVDKYMGFFDHHVRHYHPDFSQGNEEDIKKQDSHNTRRVNELCDQLNEELYHKQKIIVLVHLLDFINRGEDITESELIFITSVARNLKINEEEFIQTRLFTFGKIDEIKKKENLLIIDTYEAARASKIKHLTIPKMEGRIEVLHIKSASTFVFRYYGNESLLLNGHLVKPNRSYIWSNGSVIKSPRFGSIYYIWVAGRFIQEEAKTKFVYTASNIEYTYPQSRFGIKRFNFTEESGRLIGIIGGSGSGKSTLLKVLNGNLKPRRGRIEINGFDIHENREQLKGVIGYVPQEDFLLKQLTVYQNLYYNARLSFSNYSEEQLDKVVNDSLINFDLVEAKNLKVGDEQNTFLSGGQRKRLNIALELMREPSILLIDEPISGLSSMDSEKVMTLLKRQTLKGKLVITIIHQPSSDIFKLLDKLLVIDQGGRVIFYGNPLDAIQYFKKVNQYVDATETECLTCGNINPDQILRNVEVRMVDVNGSLTRTRKTSPEEWYKMYMDKFDPEIQKIKRPFEPVIPKSNFSIPNKWQQFKVFFTRDILSKLANRQYLLINLLEAPVLALILAFFTKSSRNIHGRTDVYSFIDNVNIPAYLFMAVIVSLFLGLVISAEEIYKDRKILNREKFLNLSRFSYLNSKIALLFLLSAIQSLSFVLVGNYILEIRGMELRYFLILFTTACWANMLGLNISSGFNSVITIYILIPLILVPQLIFSGVVVNFNNINDRIKSEKHVPLIGDVITSRWSYEGLAVAQFKRNKFENYFFGIEQESHKAIYYRTYLIPGLRTLVDEIKTNTMSNENKDMTDKNIRIVKNEIQKICKEVPDQKIFIEEISSLETFNETSINLINSCLDASDIYFQKVYLSALREKEAKYNALIQKFGGKDNFLEFKNRYYNKQLAEVVLNENELLEYIITDNEFIRLKEPIYQIPESRYGRAQFYAPVKRTGNLLIDTTWFNMIIIWLYTGLLYVVLYFDLLKKLISYIESIKINRFNRRILRILNRNW
ncbi:MAG: ATP-binding cassette domain-containing protein [Bacteroidales bacterium]|nr:ATP-binding cassette domain-containing protein [Bacteroidales bacterium]